MATNNFIADRLEMFPMFSTSNITDGRMTYSIFTTYNERISWIISYFQNLFLGEFGMTVPCSLWASLSTFFNGILVIIGISPKKKMIWVDTSRSIAVMKNKTSLGDCPFIQNPRCTMYKGIIFGSKCPISLTVNCGSPQPTTRHWFWYNILFKSFLNRWERFGSYVMCIMEMFSDILTFNHTILLNRIMWLGRIGSANFLSGRCFIVIR